MTEKTTLFLVDNLVRERRVTITAPKFSSYVDERLFAVSHGPLTGGLKDSAPEFSARSDMLPATGR